MPGNDQLTALDAAFLELIEDAHADAFGGRAYAQVRQPQCRALGALASALNTRAAAADLLWPGRSHFCSRTPGVTPVAAPVVDTSSTASHCCSTPEAETCAS